MYKFKKIIVFDNGKKIEASKVFDYFSFKSYTNAHEFLEKKGFKNYLFILERN